MTPEDESLRHARQSLERPDPPRDEVEAAMFTGMAQAITVNRERKGMTREELAAKCGMTMPKLERIENGTLNERWGDLSRVANGFGMTLRALIMEAEEHAPGQGGEAWRRSAGEAESTSAAPEARSHAAEGQRRT